MKTETRGRKKLAQQDKKTPVTIYLKIQDIIELGGKEKLKDDLLFHIKTTLTKSNELTTLTATI